jgi:hypothetical protein
MKDLRTGTLTKNPVKSTKATLWCRLAILVLVTAALVSTVACPGGACAMMCCGTGAAGSVQAVSGPGYGSLARVCCCAGSRDSCTTDTAALFVRSHEGGALYSAPAHRAHFFDITHNAENHARIIVTSGIRNISVHFTASPPPLYLLHVSFNC